ncbi:MAG: NAD(P)H-hydrate epimerase [Planctomycetes bacterium]|nr:NAD(P)H-hydrate epimerase [Planctomycetota bacterium]
MKSWELFNSQKHAVLTRRQVRDYDAWAINAMGVPGTTLMENAGRSAAEIAIEMLTSKTNPAVSIFCGAGNNGGDGFVIARHLANHGVGTQIILCAPRRRLQGEALINFQICEKMGIPMIDLDMVENKIHTQIRDLCRGCNLIVDAIFGTGFKGELSSPFAALISCLNAAGVPILSVDIPSGLDCDSGDPLPVCIEATATVSFVAAKQGFFINGQIHRPVGRLYIVSIGITAKSNIKNEKAKI